jgi:hydrogenase maturation protease
MKKSNKVIVGRGPLGELASALAGALEGATRLAVLGVGSELRSDDAAGLLVVRELGRILEPGGLDRITRRIFGLEDRASHFGPVLVLEGGSAPENLTGPIARFQPSHLVVVDAADLGEEPGTARAFTTGSIGGFESSTHSLPLSVLLGYLCRASPCAALAIGIQSASLEFGGATCPAVEAAARDIAAILAVEAQAVERRAGVALAAAMEADEGAAAR